MKKMYYTNRFILPCGKQLRKKILSYLITILVPYWYGNDFEIFQILLYIF